MYCVVYDRCQSLTVTCGLRKLSDVFVFQAHSNDQVNATLPYVSDRVLLKVEKVDDETVME